MRPDPGQIYAQAEPLASTSNGYTAEARMGYNDYLSATVHEIVLRRPSGEAWHIFLAEMPNGVWRDPSLPPLPLTVGLHGPVGADTNEIPIRAAISCDHPPRTLMGITHVNVREIEHAPSGQIRRIAIDFDAHFLPGLGIGNLAFSGSLRVDSSQPLPTGSLANLSTRLRVENGDGAGIAGFVVSGMQPKVVAIRVLGRSLARSGVAGVLPNPQFDIYNAAGRRVAGNQHYNIPFGSSNGNELPSMPIASAGSALVPTDADEAALVVQLDAGAYTVVARPEDGVAGVGIIEVYEFNGGNGSRPINISTRGKVGAGDDVMIAGFIIQSSRPKRVAIRALGPSLSAAGVTGTLADPRLELRNSAGQLMVENDDWRAGSQATEIQALGRAPSDEHEAMIIAMLPAGSYTAIVRGAGNTTGVALVEVYDLDPL